MTRVPNEWRTAMSSDLRWWQTGVIYQVLVQSYLDTNGDGQGDLKGLIKRLDYLQWLGVRAVWLSPIYPSPMAELGYDVTCYTDVHPLFGSLDDFDRLVAEAHRRELKIILDWVANHTSNQHPWFVESRSSRDHPKRDWYIWRDAQPDGSPPNNWVSVFGGTVWQWDARTDQYYYHTFLKEQPDLNWRNSDVRRAVYDAMRFWLERGVDGFRLDAACLMIKDDQFRNNPINPDYVEGKDGPDAELLPVYTRDQPAVHEITASMRRMVDEFDDRLLLGELYLPVEKVISYYGRQQPELHLPLNMRFAWEDWNAEALGKFITNYRRQVPDGCWPTWTLSTHDCLRIAFRVQGDQTRIAAMLLMTLGGTPTLYYGEEVGMRGVHIPASQARDPQGRRIGRNRDPERTPMQWDGGTNAGFTDGEPWLPIGRDVHTANVAAQADNPRSLLALYRRLITFRGDQPVLLAGGFELLSSENSLLAYRRYTNESSLLVVLNFTPKPQVYFAGDDFRGRLLLSTTLDEGDRRYDQQIELGGDEGVIVAID
jgi:alpha-glucosidase